jgi:CheY-like chemotaxis protein
VDFASAPAEATDKARKLRPALITLDILLRNGSGFGTLYDLKSFPETSDIPVIILSSVDQKRMGKALGAAEYLLKPVAPAELLSATARLIQRPASI